MDTDNVYVMVIDKLGRRILSLRLASLAKKYSNQEELQKFISNAKPGEFISDDETFMVKVTPFVAD